MGGLGQSGLDLYIVSLDGYITLVLMITALVLVHDQAHRRYVCMARSYLVRFKLSLKKQCDCLRWPAPIVSREISIGNIANEATHQLSGSIEP